MQTGMPSGMHLDQRIIAEYQIEQMLA